MQLSECLDIKQKLEVRKKDEDMYYVSSVQELNKENIHIDIPYLARQALILQDNEVIFVRFVSQKSVYEFESRFLSYHPGTIPYYEIAVPKQIQEGQRRTLFRLDMILDVECCPELSEPSPDKSGEPLLFKAKTIDISGGGVKISSPTPLKVDQNMTLTITFQDMAPLKLPAKVMWTERVVRREKPIYYAGLRFLNISRKTQDSLVSYLFKIQARRRLFER